MIKTNVPIQSTASDSIKIVMGHIDAELIFDGPAKERDAVREMVLRIGKKWKG